MPTRSAYVITYVHICMSVSTTCMYVWVLYICICMSTSPASSRILIVCYDIFDGNTKENVANSHIHTDEADTLSQKHTHTENKRETLAKCSGKYEIYVVVRLLCLYSFFFFFLLLWANFDRKRAETGE